jgi:dihydroxyacid dehydratase/phosphogluconate dehydratase
MKVEDRFYYRAVSEGLYTEGLYTVHNYAPQQIQFQNHPAEVQGASQAMLYANDLREKAMSRPQAGIASMCFKGSPCNMRLLTLAEKVKKGVVAAGLVGMRFNTIGVSDEIEMGTHTMSFSLPLRDLIADSIATVMAAERAGAGLGVDVALISGRRFCGGSHGFIVGHITPEAQEGGRVGLVRDCDRITIDASVNRITVDLSAQELNSRRERWRVPPYKATKGTSAKHNAVAQRLEDGFTSQAGGLHGGQALHGKGGRFAGQMRAKARCYSRLLRNIRLVKNASLGCVTDYL